MALTPKLPRIASIVAFVAAGLTVAGALAGPIVLLPFALIPLAAGIGVWGRRVWSAYGFSLYLIAQVLVGLVVVLRGGNSIVSVLGTIVAMGMAAALGVLFLLAGRSLAAAGSPRGRALPWIALAAVFSVPILFVQAFVLPSAGMKDTLLIGDRFLVQRFPRPSVVTGDIIFFRYPVNRTETYVKRVIGVPGDHIQIRDKAVYRNGIAIREPYVVHNTSYTDSYRDNFPSEPNIQLLGGAREMLSKHVMNGEVVVPKESYFVLGDNRDDSLDSRYWGFVPFSDVIGKPLMIYDSEDQTSEMASSRPISGPHRTRWHRLFKLL